jgi:type I restriction-modification system DNA methylase subunit
VLVEMLAPYKDRVYDPCCGSGGMFVQSEKFIEAHAGRIDNISIYGQESNYTTRRLAKMNLAIRGIDAQIAHGDSFHQDGHPDLKADYVLANPPFNNSDWRGDLLKMEDIRKHGHVLTPGRYVGAEAAEDDGEPFEEKMRRLTATLREQRAEGANLQLLGYE